MELRFFLFFSLCQFTMLAGPTFHSCTSAITWCVRGPEEPIRGSSGPVRSPFYDSAPLSQLFLEVLHYPGDWPLGLNTGLLILGQTRLTLQVISF